MSITDIMEIGKQGLDANREALQTTSNNIANANTPGYSRQRAVMHSNENSQVGQVRLGGVRVKDVIRVHDGFVQTQLLDESKGFGAAKTRSTNLHRLEDLVSGEAFRVGDKINAFFNTVRELSANPEMSVLRNNVVASARATADTFRNLSGQLNNLKRDIDDQLEVQCNQINTLTRELADLNGKLAEMTAKGQTPLELADRREQILRDLSQKIGFQVSYNDQDHFNIVASGGIGSLVNGTQAFELSVHRTAGHGEKTPGSFDIFVKDGITERQITRSLTEGEVGGLIHVRDHVINPALERLDSAAYQFATSVNDIHRQGVAYDNKPGRNLFVVGPTRQGAAETLDLSSELKQTAEYLSVGFIHGAPGDNRVALQIADLQEAKIFSDVPDAHPEDRPKTINEALDSIVGKIGVLAEQENKNLEHQTAILDQLENYRRSISGVNLEEEAINMMQYQTVFNASAKAMKVGDELLQTVLSIK